MTLAERGWPEVVLVLDYFELFTEDVYIQPVQHEEIENCVLAALEFHEDADDRLVALDEYLHIRSGRGALEVPLNDYTPPRDPLTSFFSALAESEEPLLFSATHARLRAVRLFIDRMENLLETDAAEEKESAYEALRRARHPYLRRRSLDSDAEAQREMTAEFPLIAWAPSLSYCFSVLERFLADATAIAANRAGLTVPNVVPNPKIESWLAELASCKMRIVLPPETLTEIRAIRPIRNTLVHRLALDATELSDDLRRDIDVRSDEAFPTPRLVRRALRAVEDVVCATETAFGISEFERGMRLYSGMSGNQEVG